MTVRPTPWRPAVMIPCSILFGMFGAGAVLFPGGLVLLWIPPLASLMFWACWCAIRLEVTADEVWFKMGWLGSNRRVRRSQIRAIHYYPDVISFRGPDGRPLTRTKSEWSLQQMIAVGAELQVPVYDNRRCLGLLQAKVGRLVYEPSKDKPVR